MALVGDSAHGLPPIGAQGLNLGLRDAADLIATLKEARASGEDFGAKAALARYRVSRSRDVALRTAAVDGLNRSLLLDFAPVDFARGFARAALGTIGPLRRFAMREGVAPQWRKPVAKV